MAYIQEEKKKEKIEYKWSDLEVKNAWTELSKFTDADYRLRELKWLELRNAVIITNEQFCKCIVIPENYAPMTDLLAKAEWKYGPKRLRPLEALSFEKVASQMNINK